MKKILLLAAVLLVFWAAAGGFAVSAAQSSPGAGAFLPGQSAAAFTAEAAEEDGLTRGILLRASGGPGIVLDAVWSEKVAQGELDFRLDIADAGIWSDTAAVGYLEIVLRGGGKILAVRITPMTASVMSADIYVEEGASLPDGAQPVSEQNMITLARSDDGMSGVLGISAYTSPSLLDLSVQEWNFAINNQSFTSLKEYDGALPPVSNSDKKKYAEAQIRSFFEGAEEVELGVRVVNTSQEEIAVSVLAEQIGAQVLYDVRDTDCKMYVESDDLGYQKMTLRWTIPADAELCGGIVLRRYEGEVLTKTQTFATVERLTFEDSGLSQKHTYTYTLELVDSVSQPVPKVYYRYEDFVIQPKQGQPWIVVLGILGTAVVCVGFVLAYTFLPQWNQSRGKKKNG